MGEWEEVIIGDHIDLISGFAFKSSDFITEQIDGALPVIKIKNVANGDVNLNDVVFHNYTTNLEKYLLSEGDVLISMTGNHPQAQSQVVGDVSRYKLKEKSLLNQRVGKLIVKHHTNPDFIYYLFKNDDVRFYLANQSSGSANQANISKKDILGLSLTIPLPDEQNAIASILSSLDDKIDLLHRQNATLEKMAETLFRQWFVEEAKEEWEEVKIKDFDIVVTDFVANGSFASLKENVTLINEGPGYALFIRNTDLKSDFAKKVFVDEHAYNFLSKTKLIGGEVIISSVGDVGSVFRCPKFKIPMTLGNNVVMLKSNFNTFFYLFFNSDYGQSLIYGITSGSVQEKFNKTAFRDITLNYPSLEYIREFENLVEPYFDKIDKNKEQIRTLTALRDTLLPKLISGEVKVEI